MEITEKSMEKSKEKGYSFKINIGDRFYHLMAENEEERRMLLIYLILFKIFIFS